jgi:orotate phosphoribosyltransferase
VARALIEAGVVNFALDAPVVFKSGLKAPIYLDNRRLPFHYGQWREVLLAMQELLTAQDARFDVIAGIETAGIPHSAVLAYQMRRPYVFVRKQPKDHGLGRRVEGGDVAGARVLLIEDQVTTGGSSLSGVAALREAGAVVEDCLAISSYGFSAAFEAFVEAGVRLHTLTTFPVILDVLDESSDLTETQRQNLREWMRDPHGWSERN